jgi:hypothetical protein
VLIIAVAARRISFMLSLLLREAKTSLTGMPQRKRGWMKQRAGTGLFPCG